MNAVGQYHILVHRLAAIFGYAYDDKAPDWIHPFIHLICALVPVMLMAVTVFYLIVGTLKVWSFDRLFHRHPEPLRGLEASLFKTVLKYSRKQQGQMILLSLLTMPILYLTLELPKQIVNNALDDGRFPIEMLGYSFSQVALLMMLSGLYLLAISLNGITKYTLNVFKGYVAERFLRRLFVNLRGFPAVALKNTRGALQQSPFSLTHMQCMCCQ